MEDGRALTKIFISENPVLVFMVSQIEPMDEVSRKLNFSARVSFLILASSFEAAEQSLNSLENTSFTGRREKVYLAPKFEELCSAILFSRFTQMPV